MLKTIPIFFVIAKKPRTKQNIKNKKKFLYLIFKINNPIEKLIRLKKITSGSIVLEKEV